MRARLGLLAAIGALALGATFAAPAQAAVEPEGDWVSVTEVKVNRLGGVNVAGEVSCAATYQRLVDGQLMYDENGQWTPVPFADGDLVILSANTDNYTVSQPAGRKTMIQVTHESSRMSPCFATATTTQQGEPIPVWVSCAEAGAPCRWETDVFGYDRDASGPLFDYSSAGKFKAGLLNVMVQSIGLLIQIQHPDQSWDVYFIEEGSYSVNSVSIKAVNIR